MIKIKRVYDEPQKGDGLRILADRLWPRGKKRYFEELKEKVALLGELNSLSQDKAVTLLYAAKDKERNNAQVLLEFQREKGIR